MYPPLGEGLDGSEYRGGRGGKGRIDCPGLPQARGTGAQSGTEVGY